MDHLLHLREVSLHMFPAIGTNINICPEVIERALQNATMFELREHRKCEHDLRTKQNIHTELFMEIVYSPIIIFCILQVRCIERSRARGVPVTQGIAICREFGVNGKMFPTVEFHSSGYLARFLVSPS